MLRAVIVAASLGATAIFGFAQSNAIGALVAHPGEWDGRHVKVAGTVSGLQERTALDGRSYDVMDLCNGACVRVFIGGRPQLAEGQNVSIEGTFSSAKHLGSFEIQNNIEADEGSL